MLCVEPAKLNVSIHIQYSDSDTAYIGKIARSLHYRVLENHRKGLPPHSKETLL